MGTPHTRSGKPRASIVPVRFTQDGVDAIDSLRGEWSRSEYIRQAVALVVKQGKQGPQKVEETRW